MCVRFTADEDQYKPTKRWAFLFLEQYNNYMKNHAKVGNRSGRPAYRTPASFRLKKMDLTNRARLKTRGRSPAHFHFHSQTSPLPSPLSWTGEERSGKRTGSLQKIK